MINEKLRHEKIARNKKSRKKRKIQAGKESQKEKRLRNISFAIADSKHAARKVRNVIKKHFSTSNRKIKKIIHYTKKIKELSNA